MRHKDRTRLPDGMFVSLPFYSREEKDMKVARMLFVAALIVGAGQVVNGDDGHDNSRADQTQTKRDQLRIAVQEICPTSGNRLGEHGPPIKVKVGEETVFLCCQGCLKDTIDPNHWATIHGNFARAQRICPVMKQELPRNPKWTFVGGQIIYVCCPPCTKKVAADPQTYLKKIDDLYAASLRARQARR